ncbi:MAG: hypothetical protein CL920_16300 [Deltaproteobacteria bacterium]|nr:hypothetical protein [Deltaproteobacteria bacterium]
MSRSDRVESLLRRMIASEDAKNPLQIRKQSSLKRIWPCYIRQKEGDDLVESGEFAETQVQRPPDQHSSIPRIYRLKPPFFSQGWRERGWGIVRFVEAYVAKRTEQTSS